MDETLGTPLSYAAPPTRRRGSAFAIAAFTVAVLAAAVPALMGFMIWRDRRSGSSGVMVGFNLGYVSLPVLAAVLAGVALIRGSRRPLAITALILAALATGAAIWMHGRMF